MCCSATPWTTPSARPSTRPPSCSGSAIRAARRSRARPTRGNPARFTLPRPMYARSDADFSLSGLKTALRLEAERIAPLSDQDVSDLCASFQQAIVDVVFDRLRSGLRLFRARDRRADRPGRRRRRRRQPGDPQRPARRGVRSRHGAGRAAARALHRQWRDDRLGRRRAAGGRPHRSARSRAARALAAGRGDRAAAATRGSGTLMASGA